jgi:hypothetical protein
LTCEAATLRIGFNSLLRIAVEEQHKVLQEELRVFQRFKAEWLRSNPGEFVVITGTKVAGFYSDYESAFKAGLQAAGLGKSFLVKQVWAEEPVYLIY